jgi:hypothetical protein
MRAIVFLIQLLFWLLVIRIVLRGLVRMFGTAAPAPRPRASRQAPRGVVEDLVLDRVCQTHLPRSRAVSARIAGHEELFCSAACRDKALAAVARAS